MTALAWLLWAASVWAVIFAFCVVDAPALCSRLADRIRHGGAR